MSGRSESTQATYADVLAAPEHIIAEIIHGRLYESPMLPVLGVRAMSVLSALIGKAFDRPIDGPGGWFLLNKPEIQLGEHVIVPDIAAWRRGRGIPNLDDEQTTIPPDWACEVLSPVTLVLDRAEKVPLYAANGVSHVWLVDPRAQMLEVLRLDGATYRLLPPFKGDAKVRAEPFDAIELELGALWER